MTTADPVHVALGDRAYDIHIGDALIARSGELIAARLGAVRAAIVTDTNVAPLHLDRLAGSLAAAGIRSEAVVVPAGEPSKGFPTLEEVVNAVIAAKLERGDVVIAFGGGVVGDLAGFAAGIVRRGMRFVQVPTSLLAQVDSSVGGKTGINTAHGKNLVGVFYQPELVIADTAILDTLPEREFRAGYAEVVKYGLIDDPAFFEWLDTHWRDVFAGGEARRHAIAVSCRAKAAIVARDERETGDRALLNLGHTFGHALEGAVHYASDRLVHGEAVAIGMALAHQFSERLGLLAPQETARVLRHLAEVGLPTHLRDVPGGLPDADRLLELITQDKKVSRGALTFILTRGIGKAFIARDVPPGEIRAFLAEKLAG